MRVRLEYTTTMHLARDVFVEVPPSVGDLVTIDDYNHALVMGRRWSGNLDRLWVTIGPSFEHADAYTFTPALQRAGYTHPVDLGG